MGAEELGREEGSRWTVRDGEEGSRWTVRGGRARQREAGSGQRALRMLSTRGRPAGEGETNAGGVAGHRALGAPALPPRAPALPSRATPPHVTAAAPRGPVSSSSGRAWPSGPPRPCPSPRGASHGFLGFSGPDCGQEGASGAGHLPPQPACGAWRRRLHRQTPPRARPTLASMFSPNTTPKATRARTPVPHSARRGRSRLRVSVSPQGLLPPPAPRAVPVPPKNRNTPTAFCPASGVLRGQ